VTLSQGSTHEDGFKTARTYQNFNDTDICKGVGEKKIGTHVSSGKKLKMK
jgi:hypothetical protein